MSSRIPKVRDELLAHAQRIESGELTWVNRAPEDHGECCAGWWVEPTEIRRLPAGRPYQSMLSHESLQVLARALDERIEQSGWEDRWDEIIAPWNDREGQTKDAVVAFLREVAASCDADSTDDPQSGT